MKPGSIDVDTLLDEIATLSSPGRPQAPRTPIAGAESSETDEIKRQFKRILREKDDD